MKEGEAWRLYKEAALEGLGGAEDGGGEDVGFY